MREVVLDASVLFKWLSEEEEAHHAAARALQADYERGELQVTAPELLFLELINIAVRRRRWSVERLTELGQLLTATRFRIAQAPVERVAHWAGRGLTAYDACYVALAEERRTVLITADEQILAVAGGLAERLAGEAQ